MTQQSNQSPQPHWGRTVFNGAVQLLSIPMVFGCLLLTYEITSPPEQSIWVAVQERLGEGEKAGIEATAPTEAWKEQMLQLAVAEIERVNNAYQALWQANSQIMVIAYQMEDKVLQSQIELIKGTYGATQFNANVADMGCAVGSLLGDPSLKAGCDYAEQQRIKMAREIKEITQAHRSTIPQSIIENLPKPEDLKIDTQRLRELMKGVQ